MTFELAFWFVAAVLLLAIVRIAMLRKDRDKYLFGYKPLKTERDKLAEEVERLCRCLPESTKEAAPKAAVKAEVKKAPKAAGTEKVSDGNAQASADLVQRIKEVKTENAKLKEDNYRLKTDNKALRQQSRDRNASTDENQRHIVDLRTQRDDIQTSLATAQTTISQLEKALADGKAKQVVHAAHEAENNTSEEDSESLKRENAQLAATLKDVRGELAGFKKEHRAQLDEARREIAQSNKSLHQDLNHATQQMQQSKKRADNNHKIYLIARAQLLLAEKRLTQLDASYKPIMTFATSASGIDELIKKFVTLDTREGRASVDVLTKDRQIAKLEQENKSLRDQLEAAETALSQPVLDGDDSLSDLIGELGEINETKPKNETASLADLDLSGVDDGWDEL